VKDGAYVLPSRPGYSITMKRESLARFSFPDGPVWSGRIRTKGHA